MTSTTQTITAAALTRHATALVEEGFQVTLVAGHDDGDALRVVYLFTSAADGERAELHVEVKPVYPHVPSLAGVSPAAARFERELHDLYGVIPDEHPEPRRLVRHDHWPRGWYPMRRDAGESPAFTEISPAGSDVSLGPVHGEIAEPGELRLTLDGETVRALDLRLFYVHRGLERLFEGRRPDDAIALTERISGDTAVGHTLAFCRAVEDALGIAVPAATAAARAILLELERLYNHVTDLGALCTAAGHDVLDTHAHRVRERLLRLNDTVTGHRLLRGALRPGHTALVNPPDPDTLAVLGADLAEITALALDNAMVRDRFTGTGVLTAAQAADLGTLGYVARASGLPVDTRAYAAPTPDFTVHTHDGGDVLARFLIRAKEVPTSIAIIRHLVNDLTEEPPATEPPSPHPRTAASGVGTAEAWRGTVTHRVELAADRTLTRVKIVDPSFLNAPALPLAAAGAELADLPLIARSINLSAAGHDL
jgi:Ni,Fe-hydrogenase III large subunit